MRFPMEIGGEQVEIEVLDHLILRHGMVGSFSTKDSVLIEAPQEIPEIDVSDFTAFNSGNNWVLRTQASAESILKVEDEALVRVNGDLAVLFRSMAIQFASNLTQIECEEILHSVGSLNFRRLPFAENLYRIEVLPGRTVIQVEALFRSPSIETKIEFVEPMVSKPNALRSSLSTVPSTGSLHPDQWQWNAVDAPSVWAEGIIGSEVRVAVIDRGFDYDHPNLVSAVDRERSMIFGPGAQTSQYFTGAASCSHGNMCAAQVGARPTFDGDLSGIAPGSELMLIAANTSDCSVALPQIWLAECVAYAADPRAFDPSLPSNGADVLCCSEGPISGVGPLSNSLRLAFEFVARKRIPMFWAVANRDIDIKYDDMASFKDLIRVGTCGRSFRPPTDCAFGELLDFLAPGTDVFNVYQGVGSHQSGTSYATPVAAGIAALMIEAKPDLGPEQLRDLMRQSCKKNSPPMDANQDSRHKFYGSGIVNAKQVVDLIR